jgi:hypothetical protein
MRRAGFLGHHPPKDKEHHLASRKCRRESTPQTRTSRVTAFASESRNNIKLISSFHHIQFYAII